MGKYTINGYVPNPILYNLHELAILIFFILLPIFFKIADNRKTLGVAKRLKDGYVIGVVVPLFTSSVNCIVNVAWVGYFQGFAILSVIVSVLLIMYLALEMYRFVDPCSEMSHYFNEDEAYLTFDCHPNSIYGGHIALVEYIPALFYALLPPVVYVLSNTGITTSIVFLCVQIILFCAHFKNTASNLWRADYSLFGLLNMVASGFRILYGILMILFWSLPTRLNLSGIKVMTGFFAAFYLLDLVAIILQVIARCVYLTLEASYKLRLKEFRPLKIETSSKGPVRNSAKSGYDKIDNAKPNKIHPTQEKDLGQASKRKIILANNSNS